MKHLLFFFLTSAYLGVFSQNVNVTNTITFEGEPYLAISPVDQQHLVAAWMGFKLGQGIIIKTSVSNDGGTNWSAPVELPHQVAGNSSADVSIKYDNLGNLYLCYIDYEANAFSNGGVYVRKSTDGGNSWGAAIEAISVNDCPGKLCLDRPWIAIDNSGGANNGSIYITSMNADQPTIVSPPYNPYMTVSDDGGSTFSTPRLLDTANYLAGNTIPQPMPSPIVGPDGVFYAMYPSYESSQSMFVHLYVAQSSDLGNSLDHSNLYTVLIPGVSDPFAKKAGLFLSDPSDVNHRAIIVTGEDNGDGDIYFLETLDGTSWSTPIRVNQDPISNGKLQDLVWGAYNENGDLAICWRDRRNGSANGYQTETEIYGVVRLKDSSNFEQDFAVSSEQAPHAAVLESSGNDFMNVQFIGDTLYALWGDVRTGTLNIYLNKMDATTGVSSISEVYKAPPALKIYPNPAQESITIDQFDLYHDFEIFNSRGESVQKITKKTTSIKHLKTGSYFVKFSTNGNAFLSPIIIY